jgi:hypothetical protein
VYRRRLADFLDGESAAPPGIVAIDDDDGAPPRP